MRPSIACLAAAVLTLAAGQALAHDAPPAGGTTRSLQGDGGASWAANPYMHKFYDAVVVACANGAAKADVPALQATANQIFADFAVSMHADPKAMQDHLKLIPGQIVKIAQDDPGVLSSYDRFIEALMGPK